MRFHLLGNPNAPITEAYYLDGFSQATHRFADMLTGLGHDVILYGADRTTANCTEFVQTVDAAERRAFVAPFAYQDFPFDPASELWRISNRRASEAIQKNKRPGDFLLTIGGYAHKAVFDAHPDLLGVEWSVGYEGSFASHRVFESRVWQHFIYGRQGINDGRFYDTVIPLFFDTTRIPLIKEPDDYFLYVGRLTPRKGISVACQIASEAGVKLKVVGPGDKSLVTGGHEYLGTVSEREKYRLMSTARAVICPTLFVEPFNSVAVESQLCGAPVICPNFGGFVETVVDGGTGFRCSYLGEFVRACKSVHRLSRLGIAERARSEFGVGVASGRYERYFRHVQNRMGLGWETLS
ncbi:MAG: glycosyltransferase [Candidatus Peribacteraceae bacterium]|nr:glycosyltransferase [Candidatus Peribacteraceae bacterium]